MSAGGPAPGAPLRILLVDDHEIVREGLRTLLSDEDDLEVVGEAGDGAQALRLVAALEPDLVLMDLAMPGMDGLETLRQLRRSGSAARVLILTTFAEGEQVREAVAEGALGYLLKDVPKAELVRALRGARHGTPALHPEAQRVLMRGVATPPGDSPFDLLTPRELSVLELLAQGFSNKKIGTTLHLSEGTVKGYVSAVLAKLQVQDRTQAALLAVRHGLAKDP